MTATIDLQPLTRLFAPQQLVTDPVALITYEIDAGFDRGKPNGVFYPQSTEDVSKVLRWASERRVPLVARGAGTGLSGGAVPEHGGIIIEFARMNRIRELDATGRSATVETGVINLALDAGVKSVGLYYPPDPSSGRSSTIGGNLGENAGGPHCFKYGVTTNYITGLEVVLADGRVIRTGGRALDYPEFDFTGVLVGSEGTLGLATLAEVRLIRNPPGVKTMMAAFASLHQAGEAVSAVIAAGLTPATLEMMDQKIMRMIEDHAAPGLPVEAEAGLIVEVDGYPAGLDVQMEEIADLLTQHGATGLRIAQSEEERQKIWYGRKSAAGAMARLAPTFYLVDVTVPRSQLADTLTAVNAICDQYGLRAGHVFHAGDGNLHPLILCDARDSALMARVFQACDEIVALCIAREGSITGEHGVGLEKRKYMPAMYSGAELAAMLDLKALFDPQGLLNPGKIFPATTPPPRYAAPALPSGEHFAPSSAEETAAALVALTQAKERVRIGGAPTGDRQGAKRWLSTGQLRGVKTFAVSDLYITIGAGTPISELQTFLREHQMQAPLASPWPEATIGGLMATNLNAPLRMRYGALRDVMIATTVALADGRTIRAGRSVVKNVAGYDLPKLFVGSYGALGVMTDVTLKLAPLPRSQRTLAVPVADLQLGVGWALKVLPKLFVASGLVLCENKAASALRETPFVLLITAEGVEEDVATELEEVTTALWQAGAPQPIAHDDQSGTAAWAAFLQGLSAERLSVRIGVPPKELVRYLTSLPSAAHSGAHWCVDVAAGHIYAAITPTTAAHAHEWITALRPPAQTMGGYVVTLNTPPTLRGLIDPWDYRPSTADLMRGLKARWDPAGILNPGSFVV